MIHAARSGLIRTIGAVAMSGALAVTLGACGGSEVEGKAATAKPDLSDLDVGNYQAEPVELGNAKNDKQARVRESQRLADYVALPFEIDPAFVEHDPGRGFTSNVVLDNDAMADLVINDTFDEVAEDIVAGWINSWTTTVPGNEPARDLHIAVMMFPDARTAEEVASTLEHDDFTYNKQNEPAALPKYPGTKSHWRPGISSIGSWTSHEQFVVFVKYVDETSAPHLPNLTAQVERVLDYQLPLLEKFEPTPAGDLDRIALDPDKLLGRTLPADPDTTTNPTPSGSYKGRGAFHALTFSNMDFIEENGVEAIAVGESIVFRTREVEGAQRLWNSWKPSTDEDRPGRTAEAPKGVEGAVECYTYTGETGADIASYCVLQTGRYVSYVGSPQIQDLHQRVAAQYAMLVSE